jgi:riboflavin biosynthesis pyrimidine reductase
MNALTPFKSLYEQDGGSEVPLPSALKTLYGSLRFPEPSDRPYVIGNFVTTLDGVVSLNAPGHSAGGDISGFNRHDRIVMGLLRAVADAVIVGAATHRSVPDHLWTADYIYPELAGGYDELRSNMGKSKPPLNVIVTADGHIDADARVFQSGEVPVLILTTTQGADRIRQQKLPPAVQITAVQNHGQIMARSITEQVARVIPGDFMLMEGGPRLMGTFFKEKWLDELFLTLAPQVAGRDDSIMRPGLVAGHTFAPEQPLWGTLAGAKMAGSHLFLRYGFESKIALRNK